MISDSFDILATVLAAWINILLSKSFKQLLSFLSTDRLISLNNANNYDDASF